MVGNVLIRPTVEPAFVGMKSAFLGDVSIDDAGNGRLVGVLDMEGTNGTAALDKRDDGSLVRWSGFAALGEGATASSSGTALLRCLFPKVGFVGLNDFALAAHWRK